MIWLYFEIECMIEKNICSINCLSISSFILLLLMFHNIIFCLIWNNFNSNFCWFFGWNDYYLTYQQLLKWLWNCLVKYGNQYVSSDDIILLLMLNHAANFIKFFDILLRDSWNIVFFLSIKISFTYSFFEKLIF